jgi:hypothetical protein
MQASYLACLTVLTRVQIIHLLLLGFSPSLRNRLAPGTCCLPNIDRRRLCLSLRMRCSSVIAHQIHRLVRRCLPSLTRGTGTAVSRFFGGFLRRVNPAERFCDTGGGGQQRVGLLIDVVEKGDSFSPGYRLEQHANIS